MTVQPRPASLSVPFDFEITTDRPETREAFRAYGMGFLSYGRTLPRIVDAADAEPNGPAAQAHAAAVSMAFEGAAAFKKAGTYLTRARALFHRASTREQVFIRAVEAWHALDFRKTAALLKNLTARWPEDVLANKWGQYHCFNLGDHRGLYELAARLAETYPDQPFVHGMEAFALEQLRWVREAEDAGHRAVAIERGDPWAHHAVAHVMETEDRTEEGLAWMTALSPTWEDRGTFIRLHNWWHVALYHMELGAPERALDVYDARLWGLYPGFSQELIGAISALWRLELRGVDVGTRWDPVVDLVRERPHEHILPFLDLHYVYALARAGLYRETEDFLNSMARAASMRPDGRCRTVWRDVALEAARGVAAHGLGRYDRAAVHLSAAIPVLTAIGGSHAQRAVFLQTHRDALARAGRRSHHPAPRLAAAPTRSPGVAPMRPVPA